MHDLKEFRLPRAGFLSTRLNYLRTRCLLPVNCGDLFLERVEGERLLQRLWLRGMNIATSPAMAARWARYGRLPSDFNLTEGNSVFWKWLCCCNVLGKGVKSWEGTFYRRSWNITSKPLGPTTSSCTVGPCESSSQKETLPSVFPNLGQVHPLFWPCRLSGWDQPICRRNTRHTSALPCTEQQQEKAELGSLLCPTCSAVII